MRNYEILRSYNNGKSNFYKFTENNKNDETIEFSIEYCGGCNGSTNSLPFLWKKHGYIDRVLPNYWHVSTYITDKKGDCFGIYNPQEKHLIRKDENGKTIESRMIIDFNFMFEATEENKQKIIAEIEKRAFQTFERVRKA